MNKTDYEKVRAANAQRSMAATMMDRPLRVTDLIARAEKLFPSREIVSRLGPGKFERTSYAQLGELARRMGAALKALGVKPGDRVATLMWNHATHIACYYAAPAIGAVLHPLNPRLAAEEIAYIVADAGDNMVLVDQDLLPLWSAIEQYVRVPQVYVNGGAPGRKALAELLTAQPLAGWPDGPADENDAVSICYTSGTTGRSKGVVYSHRSIILHGLGASLPDILNMKCNDTVFTITPIFHVNGWGMPYVVTMLGARHVLPGPHISPVEILDLLETEQVSSALGVPTFWTALLKEMDANPGRWRLRENLTFYSGGAAPPPEMFRRLDRYGIKLQAGWGMTECSPVGTQAWLKDEFDALDEAQRLEMRTMGGLPLPLVDVRIADDEGTELPWDGHTKGELQVRGPWIARAYIGHPQTIPATTADGWLKTGDIAVIRPDGYLRLVDRLKDLVKSGGEWISSIDMENALVSHPDVYEAAVIAVKDERWGERPLAVIAPRPERTPDAQAIRAFLEGRFPQWMIPDRIEFVAELPKTSTGKLNKLKLREQYGN
jgi:fatty-acyl-CoA synthase